MTKISLRGAIVDDSDKPVYDFLGVDAVSPKSFREELEKAKDDEITLEINSPGGDVVAANDICYAISEYFPHSTADITGYACSAASFIALACDKVRMMPSALYMIHNASGVAMGDYHDMNDEAKLLKTVNKAIAKSYRMKTGMSEEEVLNLMDKETWMSAEDAKSMGFVDEIIGEDASEEQSFQLVASIGSGLLPRDVIESTKEKILNSIHSVEETVEKTVDIKTPIARMRAKLL